ncbi:MAG: VOC family protein [Pseudomonadota bacterium]
MIGYVTVGTNDIEKAAKFYDEIANGMGIPRMMGSESDGFVAWGTMEVAGIGVTKPFDGEAATVGNGVMVALQVDGPDSVKKIYDIAMSNGATDEGAPGPRGDSGFYAGYFRDLDGNKLNVFCMNGPT